MVNLNKNENATLIVEFSNKQHETTTFNQVINITQGIISQGSFLVSNIIDEVIVWKWDGQKINELKSYNADKYEGDDIILNFAPNEDFYLRVVDMHRLDFLEELPLKEASKLIDVNIFDQIQENNLDNTDFSNKTLTVFLESDLNDNSKKIPYQTSLTFELSKNLINKFSTNVLGLVIPTDKDTIICKKYPVFTHFERVQNSNGEYHELKIHFNDRYLNNTSLYGFNVKKIMISKKENVNKLITKKEFSNNEISFDLSNSDLLNKKIILKTSVEHVTSTITDEYGEGIYVTTNYYTLDLRNKDNQTYIPIITKLEDEKERIVTITTNQETLTITKDVIDNQEVDVNLKEITFLDLEIMNVLEEDNVKSIIQANTNFNEYKTLLQKTICFDLESRSNLSPDLNFTNNNLINEYLVYECKPLLFNAQLETGYTKYIDAHNVTFQYKQYIRTITMQRGEHSDLNVANVLEYNFVNGQADTNFGWNKINFNSTLPNDELTLNWNVLNLNCGKTPNQTYYEWIHFFGIQQIKLPSINNIFDATDVTKTEFVQFMTKNINKVGINNPILVTDLDHFVAPYNNEVYLGMDVSSGPVSFPISVKMKSGETLEMRSGRKGYQNFDDKVSFEFTNNQQNHFQQILNSNMNATLNHDLVCFDLNDRTKLSPEVNFTQNNLVNTYPVYMCKPLHPNETLLLGYTKFTDANNITLQYQQYSRTIKLNRGTNSQLNVSNILEYKFNKSQSDNLFGWNQISFNSTLPSDELTLNWNVLNFDCGKTPNQIYAEWIHFFGIKQIKLPTSLDMFDATQAAKNEFTNFLTQHIYKAPNKTLVTQNELGKYIAPYNDEMYVAMDGNNGSVSFPISVKMKSGETLEMRSGRIGYQNLDGYVNYEFKKNSFAHSLQHLITSEDNSNNQGIVSIENLLGNVVSYYKTLRQETICFDLENRIAKSPDFDFNNSKLVTTYPIYQCLPLNNNENVQPGFTKYVDKNNINFQYKQYQRTFTLNNGDKTQITDKNNVKYIFVKDRLDTDYGWLTITFNSTFPNDNFLFNTKVLHFDGLISSNLTFKEWIHCLGVKQMILPKYVDIFEGSNEAKTSLINSIIKWNTIEPNHTHLDQNHDFGSMITPTNEEFYLEFEEFENNSANVSFPLAFNIYDKNEIAIRCGRRMNQSFEGMLEIRFENNAKNHSGQIMDANVKIIDVNSQFEIQKRKVIVFKPNIYIDVYEDTNLQEKSILKLIPLKEYYATQINDNLWQIHSKNLQDHKFMYTNLNLCSLNYIKVLKKDAEISHFTNMGQVFFSSEKGNELNRDFVQYFENSVITIYANEDIDVYVSCYANTNKTNFKLEQDHKYLATYTDVGTLQVCKIENHELQTGYIKYEDKYKYIVEAN